jgi:hypothetical protein
MSLEEMKAALVALENWFESQNITPQDSIDIAEVHIFILRKSIREVEAELRKKGSHER